jgi:hypothetical protein
LGSANLWKSGPFFSTGSKEAELMLDEPGMNPRMPAAHFGACCKAFALVVAGSWVHPKLSTGNAERCGTPSTGAFERFGNEEVMG